MSEDTLPINLSRELGYQLELLVNALRSTCHRPGCKNTYCCPEQCDCRLRKNGKIKKLNLHTGLVWELASEISDVTQCFAGWRSDDRAYMKSRMQGISKATDILFHASAHHDHDERVRVIFSAVISSLNTLRTKLASGRYDCNERQWLRERHKRITEYNLREAV
jgi:hypothetical protein